MTMSNDKLREALIQRLRDAPELLRRKAIPLSDFIPLIQQAADALAASKPEPLPSGCAAVQSGPCVAAACVCKPEPQAQAAESLQRWGRAPDGSIYLLEQMPDGYWTPWHIAVEALADRDETEQQLRQALKECVEALEKLRSYNEDIKAGRINYRAQDHIQVAEAAITQAQEAQK